LRTADASLEAVAFELTDSWLPPPLLLASVGSSSTVTTCVLFAVCDIRRDCENLGYRKDFDSNPVLEMLLLIEFLCEAKAERGVSSSLS
jgi:hypothetical protein